ncbi:angiopoietin-1 receptor-like [Antedon mediterranea]|uniref:angiopoietin-1 receptor-like n=1 Tax=Antedon mediterranea TaxID=105859 RepID=UPI003AF433D4
MIVAVAILLQAIICLGNGDYITVLNLGPQSNSNTNYQCYIPTAFTGYTLSYGRSFAVANGEAVSEIAWDVSGADRRWYVTEVFGMGVYYCKIVNNGVTTAVQTTKIREDALITPGNSKNTVTVNEGDNVTITFNTLLSSSLAWRKDGSSVFKIGAEKSVTFGSVATSDAGVYEMYEDGNREDRRHSFIKLIVRECPRHRWGPPNCTGDCEYCYNGGVCDDKTGLCICAPGFLGSTCETECGGNRHGWNCENRCSSQSRLTSCRNFQFCLPDPYGCSCVTGYKGLKCDTECSSGTFGADCAQTCHCKQGGCDRYKGRCTDTQDSSCAPPWTGTNCQKCQQNFYRENCEIECNKECECHRVTGKCIEGTCFGLNCDDEIDECGTGCLNGGTCTAEDSKHICKCPPGFSGPTCETETVVAYCSCALP